MMLSALLTRLYKPSLRLMLVLPFVSLVTIAVGLTGWISLRNGQKAVNELAAQLRDQVAERISDELAQYLEQGMLVNRINTEAIATGVLRLENLANLEDYLGQQLAEFEALNSIVIGTEKPDYIGLGYDDANRSSRYFSIWNHAAWGTFDWQIDDQGTRIFLGEDASYDHRTRPWYQAAVQAKVPIWSAIDLSITPQNLILSANQPFYDPQGNLLGVVSTDLGLGQISLFLKNLNISKTGEAFILERNGLLVATSADEMPFRVTPQQTDLERVPASASANGLIRKTAIYLKTQFPNFDQLQQPQQLNFKINGKRMFVGVTSFRDARGLDWLIVTTVPESDFMATIQANTRITILLCLVALALAIGVGILIARQIVQPILTLADRADALSKGDWEAKLPEPYSKELTLLTHAFEKMRKQLQASFASLMYGAYHDELTGLFNQRAFRVRLEQTIQQYGQVATANPANVSTFAVLFLDLNDFKLVNDSLGHLAGDQLLQTVAGCLQSCLRPTDTIARFGGDEFVVLLSPIEDQSEPIQIAEEILQLFQNPFQVQNSTLFLSTSIGIAFYNQFSDQPESLIRNADIALYRAKVNPEIKYEVFDQTMHTQAAERLQLETDLRYALRREELLLYYQPILDLRSFEIVGFEALVRWQHPIHGLLSPMTFIPIAEDTDIILDLGHWVLKEACTQMRVWQQNFVACQQMVMSVNVSSNEFLQANFLDQINEILLKTELDPACLKLEITETSLLKYQKTVLHKLHFLRTLGIKISLDDFGVGYSSLSYLNQFPIDALKIDRCFIQSLETNSQSTKVAEMICWLAHKLQLSTIAEGIETIEQLKKLQMMGCKYAQGYYFSRPLCVTEASEFLA